MCYHTGIAAAARKIDMFKPDWLFDTVFEITPDFLIKEGVKAVIFDIDDTVVPHGSEKPDEKCLSFIEGLKSAGIKVAYISNNPLERDPFFTPLFSLARKPSKKGYLALANGFGLPPESCLVAGDQLFTDVRGGIKAGMKTIKVKPITGFKDVPIAIKRVLERPLLRKYEKEKKR